jgi:serine/threonine protein kinase
MAPEILRSEEYKEYSDVYSFGVVLWEILNEEIPYKNLSAT